MASTTIDRLRRKIGDTSDSNPAFDDPELTEILEDAAVYYQDDSDLQLAWAIVECVETLMADAAKRVTYRQNTVSENASDIFKHLEKLADRYQAKLDKMDEASRGSKTRLYGMRQEPKRKKDIPG